MSTPPLSGDGAPLLKIYLHSFSTYLLRTCYGQDWVLGPQWWASLGDG